MPFSKAMALMLIVLLLSECPIMALTRSYNISDAPSNQTLLQCNIVKDNELKFAGKIGELLKEVSVLSSRAVKFMQQVALNNGYPLADRKVVAIHGHIQGLATDFINLIENFKENVSKVLHLEMKSLWSSDLRGDKKCSDFECEVDQFFSLVTYFIGHDYTKISSDFDLEQSSNLMGRRILVALPKDQNLIEILWVIGNLMVNQAKFYLQKLFTSATANLSDKDAPLRYLNRTCA